MLRILHVIPSVSRSEGGPSYAVFAFAKAAISAGAEAVIATTGNDEPCQDDGVKCLCFPRNFERYKVSFSLQRWLDRHVRDFELIHIHALFSFSSWAAARAARKQGVPYIVRPLGVLNRWGLTHRRRLLKRFWLRLVELPVLRRSAAIHYTAEAERAEAADITDEIAQLPSFIVPVPVQWAAAGSMEQGAEERFFQVFPKARGKKVVLFLARLDAKKGLDLLLQAFAAVKRQHSDSILVIAGTGDQKFVDQLHRQAEALRITSDIIWTGFLSGDQKAAAFSAATLYVLPSYSENFGIAAAEALAAGVPSILSNAVAIASEAAAANAAAVVRPESIEIAGAINDLLNNASKCDQLGRNARLFAQQAFSSERISEQLVEKYRKVLTRTPVS